MQYRLLHNFKSFLKELEPQTLKGQRLVEGSVLTCHTNKEPQGQAI